MALRRVQLTDAWAIRDFVIGIRAAEGLPAAVRLFVKHLASGHRQR